MSDARTAPTSKPPIKDIPTGKPEKRVSASPEVGVEESTPNPQPTAPPDLIAEQAAAATEKAAEHAAEAIRQVGSKATGNVRLLHNALQLATRNVETVITTTNVALRGAEEVTQTAVEYGQRNLEQLSTTVRNLWEVRSVGDLVALHRDHTRAVVEDLLEERTRLSLHVTKTLGEIVDTVTKPQPEFIGAQQKKAA